MIERFLGEQGKRVRIEVLLRQKIVAGDRSLAEELAEIVELVEQSQGSTLIEQDASDNDAYLILSGTFDVVVNGRIIGRRLSGDCVGEMAAVEPIQRRSASIVAAEDSVVAKLTEQDLTNIASRYPHIWRNIASELARRLVQRNKLVRRTHDQMRVFIISSAESLPIARIIQDAFSRDPFLTVVWTDGVFRATSYTLQALEDEVDQSDFAIAIAHSDDTIASRGNDWPSPRDNVVFELGLFMGRLGRARAILMEPREEKLKLPSDLAGVTTISYRFEQGANAEALMAPACNELRKHILRLGPNN